MDTRTDNRNGLGRFAGALRWGMITLASLTLSWPAAAQTAGDSSKGAGGEHASTGISHNVESAVVKVFSTMRYPDMVRPWTKQEPQEVTGSGVVIEGQRILTNAHMVLYASQIQVQASQEGDKLLARVEAIAPDMDLAVLKLEDNSFFKAHAPLPRASKLPNIKDNVLVYGFPTGGDSLSITKGIVSRIEFAAYTYPVAGLRIQIDAAINPGNSGGPAVVGDKMIGLAFSRLNNAENIGYIIPSEEIELFLKDIADGRYDGKPALYNDLQTLENAALRSYLKLESSVHGIVVNRPYNEKDNPLKQWDVITRIGDTPVDDQGMIIIESNVRVNFLYRVQQIAKQGKVPLTIVRNGRQMTVQAPTLVEKSSVIPSLKGAYPSYFIYGPLVFSTATREYLGMLDKSPKMVDALAFLGSPLLTQFGDAPTEQRQELVVISSPLFPHRTSEGYSSPQSGVVYSVNGIVVKSLNHLVSLLRDLQDEYVVFQLEPRTAESLVFNRKQLMAATEDILADNGIRAQGSPDTMAVWKNKK